MSCVSGLQAGDAGPKMGLSQEGSAQNQGSQWEVPRRLSNKVIQCGRFHKPKRQS